jgi:hypothetical protein
MIAVRSAIAGGHLNGEEIAALLTDVLGERVEYTAVSPAT